MIEKKINASKRSVSLVTEHREEDHKAGRDLNNSPTPHTSASQETNILSVVCANLHKSVNNKFDESKKMKKKKRALCMLFVVLTQKPNSLKESRRVR